MSQYAELPCIGDNYKEISGIQDSMYVDSFTTQQVIFSYHKYEYA